MLCSCRTSRETTSVTENTADTIKHSTYRRVLYMQPVPRAEVSFRLSAGSLPLNIPVVYFSDRGHVEVQRLPGDTIKITAVCDSLQRLVSLYEQQIDELNTKAKSSTTVEVIAKPVAWFYKASVWLNIGLLLHVFLPYLLPLLKRILTKK